MPGEAEAADATHGDETSKPDGRLRPLSAQLRSISGQVVVLPTGARAALRRMDPEAPGRATGEVVPLLVAAGVPRHEWASDDGLRRWARLCHLIAVLAGVAGREAHAPVQERAPSGEKAGPRRTERAAGRAIHAAGLSELRLMRLTSARGPALGAQVDRLGRYLAAAGVAPVDLTPLADLVLADGRDEDRADRARLDIARTYYAGEEQEAKEQQKPKRDGL